jgi:prepilin-type processing-associated H-X9-DG protein
MVARTDYAANTGDQDVDQFTGGPSSLQQGDTTYGWGNTNNLTGVIFLRSEISISDISRGTSNTYLLGERYLNPRDYDTGRDSADNECLYVGFDNDINRETHQPPLQDRAGHHDEKLFGSAHFGGLNMVYCDGSVRFVNYGVDPEVHRLAGRRK